MGVNKTICKKRIIWTCIAFLWLLFILGQSLLPAKTSGAESGRIVTVLNYICEFLRINITLTSHFVRKFAHFFEFAVLGFILFYTINQYLLQRIKVILFTPLLYISVAIGDECLQLLSDGRACSVSDMLLDTFGATVGFLIAMLICFLSLHFKKGKN